MASATEFEDHSKQEVKYTTCYMCACRCGIKVTVEDNKVRFIQGNRNTRSIRAFSVQRVPPGS
jgi:Molybdopterin oxidoreductase Fe4S4 domain.